MLQCKVCQIEFTYSGPRGPNYKALTCSKSCRSRLLGMRNAENRIHEPVVSRCVVCEKDVVNRVTCSRECHGKRLSSLYAGRTLTEEWKARQNSAKKRENILKEGDFECEVCGKHFDTNTSLRSHSSHCKTESGVLCQICGKICKSERYMKIHLHVHDEQRGKARSDAARRGSQKRRTQSTSRAELEFYEKLIRFFGEGNVVHKLRIEGCSHEYDFYIPSKNMIIEFDGDYWHGNKSLHVLTPRMKRQHRLDRVWDEKALEAGYSIKRIWESESKELRMETL